MALCKSKSKMAGPLLLLSKRLVTQAYVLVFRSSDRQHFLARLQSQEGLNEKTRKLELGSVDIVIGYSQKSLTRTLVNFAESITTIQWEIALQKVLEKEQSPKLFLTIKVIEFS